MAAKTKAIGEVRKVQIVEGILQERLDVTIECGSGLLVRMTVPLHKKKSYPIGKSVVVNTSTK